MSRLMIILKKNNKEIVSIERSNIIDVKPTYDGIVFNCKEGLTLSYTDSNMPPSVKDLITNSCNSFQNTSLTVDLSNFKTPVLATMNNS